MALRISYDLSRILTLRRDSRVFGNFDTNLYPLTSSEIVSNELDICFSKEKLNNIFNRDDVFFSKFKTK